MGTYYNPPDELPTIGKQLIEGSFAELTAQLSGDELLFGLYDRGPFKNAVHLYSENETEEFEGQVRNFIIDRIGFFALPREIAEQKSIL